MYLENGTLTWFLQTNRHYDFLNYTATFIYISLPSQQKQTIYITFMQRRLNIFDVGPKVYKCYTNVLSLLGWSSGRFTVSTILLHAIV